MSDDERPAILLSGGKTTVPLAKPLAERFRIGVFAQETIPSFLPHLDEVLCPRSGAGAQLKACATNDAAQLTARVIAALSQMAETFSVDGVKSDILTTKLGDWLPGLVLTNFSGLALDLRALEAFCQAIPTAAIVTHEDVTPRFRALALFGKAHGIPTVHVPHANLYIQTRPDIHDESVCDWILAASPWMRDWYAERGYPEDRIRVVGFPLWDWANKPSVSKEHARLVLHLEQDRPVVLFCTSWPQSTNLVDDHKQMEKASRAMLKATRANDWQLIWSLHPGDPKGWEQKYAEMCKEYRVPALVVRGHLPYTLAAADVVVAVGPSNVLVAAGLADRPPVTVELRGYGFGGEPPWVVKAEPRNLAEMIRELLADRSEWDSARADFVERYTYKNDGGATERIATFIEELVG